MQWTPLLLAEDGVHNNLDAEMNSICARYKLGTATTQRRVSAGWSSLFFYSIKFPECIEMSALVQSRYAKKTVPKSKKPRITFRKKVELRQSSAKDNNGDTIPNTAICTDHDHCPLLKGIFFDTLVEDILKKTNIDNDIVRDKLEAAFTDHKSILEDAIWVISYLEDKKKYLIQNKTMKTFLGPHCLQFQHIFIIEKIIEILENIRDEEEEKEKPSSICPEVGGCTIAYHDSIKLIF